MTTPTNSDAPGNPGRGRKPTWPADPAALRQEAEVRVKHRHAANPPRTEADLRHLQQELEIHQAELELQNESLLESQVELQTALERYTQADDLRHLQQELEVHQAELELQNEGLLETQAELQTSLERYTDFYDFAPVGYLTLGPDGEIRQLNPSAAKLLGAERSHFRPQ